MEATSSADRVHPVFFRMESVSAMPGGTLTSSDIHSSVCSASHLSRSIVASTRTSLRISIPPHSVKRNCLNSTIHCPQTISLTTERTVFSASSLESAGSPMSSICGSSSGSSRIAS